MWIGFIWHRVELVADSCDHGNEPSGSRNVREFLLADLSVIFSRSTLLQGVGYFG